MLRLKTEDSTVIHVQMISCILTAININVTLHLSDGSEIITVDKLGEIEKRINEKRFLRCHQSYLVNMDYIKDVEDDFIMEDGTLVPIRVRGRKEILDTYYDYFVNHFGDSKDTFAE